MPTGIGGEVAWWVPSLTSESGTTVTNQVGGINNGTLSNSSMWATDPDGKRCIVTTTTDIFSVAHNTAFNLPDEYSLSLWFKFSSYVSNAGVSNKGGNSPRVMAIVVNNSSNGIYWQHGTTANAFFSCSLGSPSFNIWHNIIISKEKSGSTFTHYGYVNNVLIATTSHTSTPVTSTSAFQIGGDVGATRLPLRFDDVRLFHEVLSSTKRAQLASWRGYDPTLQTPRRRTAQASIRSTF
jgi:hypothetical protein